MSELLAVAQEHTTLVQVGRLWKGICPFHGGRQYNFMVMPERDEWACFCDERMVIGNAHEFEERVAR